MSELELTSVLLVIPAWILILVGNYYSLGVMQWIGATLCGFKLGVDLYLVIKAAYHKRKHKHKQ